MSVIRSFLCAMIAAGLVLGGMPGAAWAASPLAVKVGQSKDLTHIEFPGSDPVSVRREGADVVLRFARASSQDVTELKIAPPRGVKAVAVSAPSGGLELRFTPAEGAIFKLGKADGASYLNVTPDPNAATATAQSKDQTPGGRANPVPANGTVKMQTELAGRFLTLKFPWRAPLGAAVFRRGEAIWIVFDAKAGLDLAAAPHGLPQLKAVQAVQGRNYSAVRIIAPASIQVSADSEGNVWSLTLGPEVKVAPASVTLTRDDSQGSATLAAQVAGSTGVFWLTDPAVGDKIAVVTALGPAKGLSQRRSFVDATLLATTQGLAVEPATEDLTIKADGDIVHIARPRGLALSPSVVTARQVMAASASPLDLPHRAALPALIDFDGWSKTGEGGFIKREDALLTAAAEEGEKANGSVEARLGLARFLVGSGLGFEAIGVLTLLAKTNQTILGDAEFRGLRGAARAISGRYKDAQADFSSPTLADDPASALWRGYLAAKLGDWQGAHEQFGHGRSALAQFTPVWRARFARLDAEAALNVGDLGAAQSQLSLALAQPLGPTDAQAVQLTQAHLAEALKRPDEALRLYDQVGRSDYGALAAPAMLRATQIRLDKGQIQPPAAATALQTLLYRWRGDATELETVRALAHIYLSQGRWRDALETLRSAGPQSRDQPAAIGIAADISTAFKALFLDGQADGLQPIQAMGLFFDFKDYTPIGTDGDLMVRRMVKRLVAADLLTQASALLKYQVDNRLNGVTRAQVATDLAIIDLMDKRPEDALGAINSSRSTLLPTALNAQRRIVEARALLALGRADHALELLEGDKSSEAQDLRAEVEWKQRNWTPAAILEEKQLGDRWKSAQPLSAEEQGRLMRASVAYSLAGDDRALTRLRTRYAALAEGSSAPDALRVSLSGVSGAALSAQDFARAASDAATFAGWVVAMKKRFNDKPSWLSGPTGAPIRQAETATGKPEPKKG